MRTALITASKLENSCPGAFALPQAFSRVGAAALRGTYIHGYLEHYLKGGAQAAATYLNSTKAQDPEWREACETFDFPRLEADLYATLGGLPTEVHCEIAYRYLAEDDAVSVVGYSVGRDYQTDDPFAVCGTADAVLVRECPETGRRTVLVVDYKTGAHPVPGDSPQMLFLGACAWRAHRADEGTLAIVQIAHHARPDEPPAEPPYEIKPAPLQPDAPLLAACQTVVDRATAQTLHKAGRDRLLLSILQPSSANCKWCRARPSCPAKRRRLPLSSYLQYPSGGGARR